MQTSRTAASARIGRLRRRDLIARYRPIGPTYATQEGNLDHFLTNRFSLFTADKKGRIYRGDIHHAPWPLQRAEAEIESNEMSKSNRRRFARCEAGASLCGKVWMLSLGALSTNPCKQN